VRRLRELADPLAARDLPVPPRRLRARTGAPGAGDWSAGGATAALELDAAAPLERFSSVLDLGCGSGRVLAHVAERIPKATGCDVDGEAIAWASEHHPQIEWVRTRFDPPLQFGDEQFELVYSISVFSHLDEATGDGWLAEVARVLAPGGVALLSVHGQHAFEQFRSGAVSTAWCPRSAFERGPLGEREFVFVPYVRSLWNRGDLPGVGARYGLAFHGPQYVASHWSPSLGVVDVKPRAITAWQDLVVCQKPS
jgi:SAM-dependent methyltransferase